MAYNFLKKETKLNLITITSGLMLNIDFLKNLKWRTCPFKITPVLNNFVKDVGKSKSEKNNCLKLVEIRKIFWKKYSTFSKIYLVLEAIKKLE